MENKGTNTEEDVKVEGTGTEGTNTEGKNTAEGVKTEGAGTETKATEKSEAQKLADSIVAKKLKDMPTKEEVKAYKEWKKSQQTEAEKQAEIVKELEAEKQAKATILNENITLKSGVNADDVDYVVYKVSTLEGDFEDNLKDFLKANPKYLKSTTEQKATGMSSSKSVEAKESGVEAILKAKHPELFKN